MIAGAVSGIDQGIDRGGSGLDRGTIFSPKTTIITIPALRWVPSESFGVERGMGAHPIGSKVEIRFAVLVVR